MLELDRGSTGGSVRAWPALYLRIDYEECLQTMTLCAERTAAFEVDSWGPEASSLSPEVA